MNRNLRFAIALAVLSTAIAFPDSAYAQANAADDFETLTWKLKYVRVAVAAGELKALLNNPNAVAANAGPPQPGGNGVRQVKPHTVEYDDSTNMLFVTGSADKIKATKQFLKKFDVPEKLPPLPRGALILKTYQVPEGKSESTAKLLLDIYNSASSVRISAHGTKQICVYATGADQMEITKLLDGGRPLQGVVGVFALKNSKANKIAEQVLDKLSNDTGAPLVKAGDSKNAVVVFGSPNQVEAVRLMIESLSGEKVQASQEQKGEQP